MNRKILLAVLIISSCSMDRDREVAREKVTFTTTDDSEIFFRNMRASYYDKEEKLETRWEIYRHEDLYNDTSGYAINAAIVVNIMEDQAYILIELGEKLQELDEIVIYASDSSSTEKRRIVLGVPNKEAMLEFATQLYEAIRDKKNLILTTGDESIPILDEPERRNAFRLTMGDYYRLTNIF